jgi:acetyl esterase
MRKDLEPPALTPKMAEVLERIRRVGRPPFHALSVAEARAAYVAGAEVLDLPRALLERVDDVFIPVGEGGLRSARVFAASRERLPVLLYLHGGGFVVGGIETHDSLCRQLALRSGCALVSLDYRLAPEAPFPAAVDDSCGALAWLAAGGAETLGLDGRRIAVGGDSAGGTLAAVAALWARDQGLPLVVQLLITPGTDAHADQPSHRQFANGYLLDALTLNWFFDRYLPRVQRGDWRFAPLHAEELDGLAPACVVLAECDPLVDEGLAYADRLRASGVPVELELYRGVTHDFIKMGRFLPEAHHALAAASRAIQKAFS